MSPRLKAHSSLDTKRIIDTISFNSDHVQIFQNYETVKVVCMLSKNKFKAQKTLVKEAHF